MPKSNRKLNSRVYLDYASSAFPESANPGAIHALGVKEKNKLEEGRRIIAKILNARANEIIFTSGSTESNNLAILGLLSASGRKIPHIISTNIEHSSVLEIFRHLEKTKKAEVTYVEAEPSGIINPEKIKKALRLNTILVSVMYANGEIGTIEPLADIGKVIRHYNKTNSGKIVFHTDATQAVNYLPMDTLKLGVDLLSLSGAKIYGPKGIGVLFKKRSARLAPLMWGGGQEFGLRPGTENVALVSKLAEALQVAERMKKKEGKRSTKLRDYFFNKLEHSNVLTNFRMTINGDLKNRLPNNVNVSFPNIPSDLLVIELSERGVMASAKSACESGESGGSYVIKALRFDQDPEIGGVRFSLGRETTKADIDYTVRALSQILTKLKKWYAAEG